MKIRTLLFAILGLSASLVCISKVSAQLSILDDFSTNSNSNYNIVDAFNDAGAYGISNVSFAPTQPSGYGTTYFLRNTGEYLSASGGQSVSIDIPAVGTAANEGYLDAAGIGFSTSLTSDQNGNELLLTQDNSNTFQLGSLGVLIGPYITNGFSLANGPATLTITREATNPTLFYYTLTGGGLAQPAAEGTLTYPSSSGLPVYFGMAVSYSPYDSATSIREDNLSFGVQGTSTNNTQIPVIQNPSFETPNVGPVGGYYSYLRLPTNAEWVFTGANGGNAGIAANGSGWSYYQAGTTNGTQYAFLQGFGGVGASMSQTISNFPTGTYTFTFTASQRDRVGRDNSTNQTVTVLVDGANVGSFTPADTNWYSFQTEPIFVTAGNHTLTFTNLPVAGNATILMDNVGIQQTADTNSTNAPNSNIIAPFSPIPNQIYGVAPFSITPPTASSGLPVTLSVLSGPATLSNNTVTITGVGTVVLAADQSGTASYSAATEVTTSFSVTSGTQTITPFSLILNQVYGVAPFSITPPTASSGLPVTLSVLSGPATLSNNTVTITGVGAVVLAADQSGNADYSAATEVTTSFTVTPASQSITAPSIPSQTYGVGTVSLSATDSAGLPITYTVLSGPATVSNNILTITGAGTVTVVASQTGNSNYDAAAQVTNSFTVAPDDQTIAPFAAIPTQVSGIPFIITPPTASSGLPVTVTVQSGPAIISSNTVTPTGAGAVVLAANQPGNSNYSAALEVTTSVVVKNFSQTITPFAPIPNKTFGDAPFRISSPVSSSRLPVVVTVQSGPATILGNVVTMTGAGTVVLAADQAGNSNFIAAPEITTTFSVAKANQRLVFPEITVRRFLSTPIELDAKASSGLPVTYSVLSGPATVSDNLLTLNGAGMVEVVAAQAGDSNYNQAASVTNRVKIGGAAQSISFPDIEPEAYNGTSSTFSITPPVASSGLAVVVTVKSGPATISGNTVTLLGTGRVVLAANQSGNGSYLPAREVEKSFVVKAFSQTIASFTPIPNQILGSAPIAITPPLASSGLRVRVTVKSGPARIDGDKIFLEGAGTVVLAANQDGNLRYTAAPEVTTSFQVEAAK